MSGSQMFVLMAVIYFAPHVPRQIGQLTGWFYLLMAVVFGLLA